MSRLNRNGNGRIDSREVLTAIAAYNDVLEIGNESVSERDLLEVIAAFNSKRATVEFLTLLTGRHEPDSPDDRRLYLTVQAVVDEFSGDDRGFWRRLSERLHRGF